jgi:GNAT superfamily N-acetyltransferase
VRVVIRPVQPVDEPRWRELWDAYTRFYQREPEEDLTRHTWARILDGAAPVHAIVAEADGLGVVGIANYVVHQSTSTITPVCYLQDLYVDPTVRAAGVGRRLLEWLYVEAATRNWSRLYWQTKEDNYRARALYDRFTPHSGFVRYVLTVPPIV